MRVLHIVQTLRGGGAETFVRALLPRLHDRGIDAAVVTMYEANVEDRERQAMKCEIFEVKRRGRFDATAPYRMLRFIKRYKPDIVHTHVFTGKYWGRLCALLAGAPAIVHTEHSPRERVDFWERPAALVLGRRTMATITFSERTARFIEQREGATNLHIIPNGIEIASPPSSNERATARDLLEAGESVVVAVVANLYPQKNHELALEAFSMLSPDVRGRARLDVFGTGPLAAHLQRRAVDLKITPQVRFHGFQTNLPALLPGVDVLLSVALVEAAPISFLEAMQAQVPIVGTPSIGTLDMVDDGRNGIVVPTWQPEDVARALERAIRDDDWRMAAGKYSRRKLEENYDIEIAADRHVELYEALS